MDLFDLGTYFSSYVPIKALVHPLLKCAACAYAAKHLGRMNECRDRATGGHNMPTQMMSGLIEKSTDWYYCGAKYYDEAIQLLMKTLQDNSHIVELVGDGTIYHSDRRTVPLALQDRSSIPNAKSDEVLAATAILCVYEFLDASGPAWNRHLSGAKSLLDVAQSQMIAAEEDTWSSVPQLKFSAARRAIFWNFARQDYLSGRECLFARDDRSCG